MERACETSDGSVSRNEYESSRGLAKAEGEEKGWEIS